MTNSMIWIAGLLSLGTADAPRPETEAPVARSGGILLRRCTMDYGRSSLLGSPGTSTLQDCLVAPGDRVRAGQVLGRIQDREIRAEMALRQFQAESDVEVRLSEARHAQASARLKVSDVLRARNALSVDQYNIDRLATTVAALEVEAATNRRRVARIEFEQARAAALSREITAPHDGIVVAVFRRPGEAVTPNNPVFHVVDVDRIWVTGGLDVDDAWRVEPGQSVEISPVIGGADLEVERRSFPGRVIFVDRIVDAKTQTCKVVAELDNREGLLRAGLGARMEVLPPEAPGAGGAPPSATSGPGLSLPAPKPDSKKPATQLADPGRR
jgi:RND family efflux transporter MFP subunit